MEEEEEEEEEKEEEEEEEVEDKEVEESTNIDKTPLYYVSQTYNYTYCKYTMCPKYNNYI